jgi:AraC family transcriptional regulator
MTNGRADAQERAALSLVHKLAEARLIQMSPAADWQSVAATRFCFNRLDVELPALGAPAFGVNYGPRMQLSRFMGGRRLSGIGHTGHLSLLPPDVGARWVFDKPGDVAVVVLNRRLFDDAAEQIASCAPGAIELKPEFAIRNEKLEGIAHRLLAAIRLGGTGGRLDSEGLAVELAEHLVKAHSNREVRGEGRRHAMAPSRLRRAQEFVLSNLSTDIALKDIAAAAGMSVFHFAKAFKDTTGKTPYGYVTEHRLHRARSLLHDRRLSIAQIARAVGLSHGRFAIVFKRRMRMTPSEFRAVLYA